MMKRTRIPEFYEWWSPMSRLLLAVAVCVSTCGLANAQYARCAPVQTRYVQRVYYYPATACRPATYRTVIQRVVVPRSRYASPVVRHRWNHIVSPVPIVLNQAAQTGTVAARGSVNVGSTVTVPVPDPDAASPTVKPPVLTEPKATEADSTTPVPVPLDPEPTDTAPSAPTAESTDTKPVEPAPAEATPEKTAPVTPEKPTDPPAEKDGDLSLFDGKTLEGWKKTDFGGEGDVEVQDGVLVLNEGADITGVHTERKLPRINYEVEFDAQRIDGTDFFVGLTFPVKEKYCSLIMGGWGGGVCGLSSIDGYDASENPTTSYQEFKKGQWYHVRLRVTPDKIEAWLDKQKVVDQTITKRDLSIRFEVEPSRPFGFASYQTIAGLKNIKLRKVDKPDSPPEVE